MAELITYRRAIALAIAREMRRDSRIVCLGEDIGRSGGVFKATEGLFEEFGPQRIHDTPISEQAIIGAAIGAAMTGIRPIVEVMFSDFLATCWDGIANEAAKLRYMTGGQVTVPMVVRTMNGAGLGFGAQHSQSVENWAMSVPGLKVVAPSTPSDLIGLMASAVRSDDPVMFFEHKGLLAMSGPTPPADHVVPLGQASTVRTGSSMTVVALAATVHTALAAADVLSNEGIELEVIDLRSLVPLDVATVLASVSRTGRLLTVEENPRLCGWGGELVSIVVEEAFDTLDAPPLRVTTKVVPVPFGDLLEDAVLPTTPVVVDAARGLARY